MKIIISPFAKPLLNYKTNPKNYPYWSDLVLLLNNEGHRITQIGTIGESKIDGVAYFVINLPIKGLLEIYNECDTWISIDSFWPHLVHNQPTVKPGYVIWSLSDPNIFGYKYNMNILKDRKYLRKDQFLFWEGESYNFDAFLSAKKVFEIFKGGIQKN